MSTPTLKKLSREDSEKVREVFRLLSGMSDLKVGTAAILRLIHALAKAGIELDFDPTKV